MSEATETINTHIASLSDWQRDNLEMFRRLVHGVEPSIKEDWKWSVPVFSANGKLVCAMSTFKEHTKFNFFEGASLIDKHSLFNSGLDSKRHRSINLRQGESIDQANLRELISEAVTHAKDS